ncbi:MAG: 2-hydroxychromene-2-carboxylate isomerase [Rubrivivax sp.]|jgi:2-hydroxychromene-2-carboxylate isomerase|nr:2-hydroxychromene-2-carboxylate isomerase [Rubrivivax sp.]
MTAHVDFFFNFGSTYSYLAVMRLEDAARQAAVTVNWRPFNVRKLFVEQTNIPFPKDKAAKVAYMWRDIERRAERFGLAWNGIPPYPVDRSGLANRLGVIAGQEGWAPEFTRAAYRAWFIDHQDFGQTDVAHALLTELGHDAAALIARANSDDAKAAFDAETDVARSLGIFGVPTFAVGNEIFWGHDRMDDALDWALATRESV